MRDKMKNGHKSPQRVELDDIDRRLISLLQQDGRISYADLSREVGLTAPGIRIRVMRLQDEGVLQIVAVTDPLQLGYESMAQVAIRADGDAIAIADALREVENVIYVVLCAGSYDLMAEVVAADKNALFDVINNEIKHIPGVGRIETFMYYGIHTHRFNWRVRAPAGNAEAGGDHTATSEPGL
ncbi:MAG: Lrp/AsnC family transcriptional regulator [Parvibaculaceae bacterium]|nr:Lrp/AsnC family transcriptional regulator [Parvibaculaceae bacterium]